MTTNATDGAISCEQEEEPTTAAVLRALLRERAKRRKSPWNALLFLLWFGGLAATWYGFLRVIVAARNLVLDQHVASVNELMRSGPQGFAAGVCFACSFFAAIPIPGLVVNCIFWCTPVRRVFEKEAEGVPDASFREAQRGLLLFALYLSLPALLLALGGGLLMRCRLG